MSNTTVIQLQKDAQEQADKAFAQACNLLEIQHGVRFDSLDRHSARVGNVLLSCETDGVIPILVVNAKNNYFMRGTRKGVHVFSHDVVRKVPFAIRAFLDELHTQNKIRERMDKERVVDAENERIIRTLESDFPGAARVLRSGIRIGQLVFRCEVLGYPVLNVNHARQLLSTLHSLEMLHKPTEEQSDEN